MSWKRSVCVFVCVCVLTAGCSCSWEQGDPSGSVSIGQAHSPNDPGSSIANLEENYALITWTPESLAEEYGYQRQLSGFNHLQGDTLRKCYRLLLDAVYRVSNEQSVDGHYRVKKVVMEGVALSKSQVMQVVIALRNDNPQLFWVLNDLRYGVSDGSTVIQLCSYFSGTQVQKASEKMDTALKAVLKKAPKGSSEFERELYLHDQLISLVEYHDEAEDHSSEYPMAFSAYGALVDGKAVCEGYSRAMQLLSNCLGLQCALVTGVSQEIAHMWNLIRIEGDWYHLDLTWDDAASMSIYQYFNLTDEQISVNHTMDPLIPADGDSQWDRSLYNLYLPECTSLEYNYYHQKAVQIHTLGNEDDQEAMDAVLNAAARRERTISFQFSPDLDFDIAVARLLTEEPYKYAYYVHCANAYFGEEKAPLQEGEARYVLDKNQRAVTIELLYR